MESDKYISPKFSGAMMDLSKLLLTDTNTVGNSFDYKDIVEFRPSRGNSND